MHIAADLQHQHERAGPRTGDLVGGAYRLGRCIGRGGMGTVWSAINELRDERVAVKVMSKSDREDDESRSSSRFAREARIALALQSEHVVRVFDFGHLPDERGGFIVMEELAGVDLAALVRARGALPPDEAADLLIQACIGLAEAHARGVVHRDLKPSNLFLATSSSGRALVKVLDFGVSKIDPGPNDDTLEGTSSLTETSAILGSPSFMSPEQVRSPRGVDARSDVWSLGVVLYYLLSGKRPFHGESVTALCASIVADRHTPLGSSRAGLPARMIAIVDMCLSKERELRPASVAELAQLLAEVASPRGRLDADRLRCLYPDAALRGASAAAARKDEQDEIATLNDPGATSWVAPHLREQERESAPARVDAPGASWRARFAVGLAFMLPALVLAGAGHRALRGGGPAEAAAAIAPADAPLSVAAPQVMPHAAPELSAPRPAIAAGADPPRGATPATARAEAAPTTKTRTPSRHRAEAARRPAEAPEVLPRDRNGVPIVL